MGLFAKLYVDDKMFTVLVSNHNMYQGTDETGKPNARPEGGMYTIIIESTDTILFFEWMVSDDMMKEAKIVFFPVTLNGKNRTIKLLDTHCVFYKEHFVSDTIQAMTTTVVLSPASIVENGEVMFKKHWWITDPNPVKVIPTPVPVEKKFVIQSGHFEDENGNEIDEKYNGKATLIIKTKHGAGKVVNIDLSNKNHDFKYQGMVLENDVLTNISINGGTTKVVLEIIEEQIN